MRDADITHRISNHTRRIPDSWNRLPSHSFTNRCAGLRVAQLEFCVNDVSSGLGEEWEILREGRDQSAQS